MLEFAHPRWLWLLLVLAPWLVYEIFGKRRVFLIFPEVSLLKQVAKHSSWWRWLPVVLRGLTIILLVIAIARPRLANKHKEISGRGIDIVLAIDVSGSMKAVDLRPKNRLEASKRVASDFIEQRENDRIGIVIFSESAFTQCPLTLDYNILNKIMESIEVDEDAQGTAIGNGLAMSVARLSQSDAKSKVIILITDGRNNTGEIQPLTAAEMAETYGIKVYTIGVGKEGPVDFPYIDAFGRQRYSKQVIPIDMVTLNKIAQITGTRYARRAQSTEELTAIINQIDEMERSEIKVRHYYEYNELFIYFLWLALLLVVGQTVMRIMFRQELP
ncbi:MAG: VWA domain-containing protein [Candidatus Cloacimonetes bacterium]|nr:VWA domain-containing protein [Candidatus Cloacimonadota bacterium]